MRNTLLDPYINQISNRALAYACWNIGNCNDFFTHPASTGIHHGYIGGLAIHTQEVIEFALDFTKLFPQTNKDVLIAAALWHDYCKIWDYVLTTYFKDQYNELPKYYVLSEDHGQYKKVYVADKDYKNKIHHIIGSTAEFTAAAIAVNVERKVIQDVQAAIISHHGPVKEWGSPKAPQDLESWILHSADYASAHFGPRKDK